MTINDEIVTLANQLANEGNKPTVALIKTKLNKKVPLPVIISTLKSWQHDPTLTLLPGQKYNDTETTTAAPFEQELHDELANMKKEIRELKQLVQKLINQQKN